MERKAEDGGDSWIYNYILIGSQEIFAEIDKFTDSNIYILFRNMEVNTRRINEKSWKWLPLGVIWLGRECRFSLEVLFLKINEYIVIF